jgi:polyisoprenoid-binding protein YceI
MVAMARRGSGVAVVVTLTLLLTGYSTALAVSSGAQDAVLELDPANTLISYTLKGWPHISQGTFKLQKGVVRIDPATGKATGSVIVDANSVASGSHMRDGETRNSILETGRYPTINFNPQQVEGQRVRQGDFPIKAHGTLMLHGAAHEVTIEMVVRPAGDDFTATGHFAVPYVAWGMKNPSILMFRCADTVDIDVSAHGHVRWVAAPSANSGALPSQASSSQRSQTAR